MSRNHKQGYTSVELLLVLAMSAIIIGGSVVSFGTLVRNLPRVSSVVEVELGSKLNAYYGTPIGTTKKTVNSAPNYGAVVLAEKLHEQFNYDVISATAVYCLARNPNTPNTYHPTTIPYTPGTDWVLDNAYERFIKHLDDHGLPGSSLFIGDRNFSSTNSAATIFILGYSKNPNELAVIAVYDIDVVKVTKPDGFFASVRRYVGPPSPGVNEPQGYDVFFPPYDYNSTTWANSNGTTDGFTPIFVTFERSARSALSEGSSIERFKKAAERPFYFIWWPDPGASDLRKQINSYPAADARQAYNHQGGRTSFMFTVPMFPSL